MSNIIVTSAPEPIADFIFAHGAGAPMDSDFMEQLSQMLAQCGINVYRFEFEYMAKRRIDGIKRPPPRLPKTIAEYQRVLLQLREGSRLPIFIGGKSMGGRVATHVNLTHDCAGVICLGYPFHPPGKKDKLRTEHLSALKSPVLIVQGERDTLGNADEIRNYDLPSQIQIAWLTDGDHSFKPRKASGVTEQQNWQSAVNYIHQFVSQHV